MTATEQTVFPVFFMLVQLSINENEVMHLKIVDDQAFYQHNLLISENHATSTEVTPSENLQQRLKVGLNIVLFSIKVVTILLHTGLKSLV